MPYADLESILSARPKTLAPALFTPSWRLHPEIYCFRNSLSAPYRSFPRRIVDTMEGRKDDEEIEGGEGIFRRTLGEEMKISNGVRETVYSFRLVVENRDEKSRDMAGT